jgi:hypothetical protein
MRAIYSAVLFGFTLLIAVSTASAECAWVLWSAPSTMDPNVPWEKASHRYHPSDFVPIEAYKTAASCNQAWSEKTNREGRATAERHCPGAKIWNTYIFRCLPDTVDPRASKTQ